MSGKVVGWAFEQGQARELAPTHRYVLIAYADNASEKDAKCWPDKPEIVEKTGLSQATVYRAIKALEEAGLLTFTSDEKGRECVYLAVPWSSQTEKTDSQGENDLSHSEKRTNKGTVKNRHTASVEKIFDFWVDRLGKTEHRLTPTRRKKIDSRLAEGFDPKEICEAIIGITHSPHHMGENTNGRGGTGVIYDDLELICRNPENVEKFRDLYRQAKARGRKGADVNERRRQIRREQGLD